MSDRLVTVATFASPVEAYPAKHLLEAAEIPTYLADENSASWVWGTNNAAGEIKLQVQEEHAERALGILAEREPVSEGQDLPPEEEDLPPEMQEAAEASESPDLRAAGGDEDEEVKELPTDRGDAAAARALKFSVIGLLLCPPILQSYSLWLLLQLALSDDPISPTGNRNQIIAFVINVVVLGLILASVLYYR